MEEKKVEQSSDRGVCNASAGELSTDNQQPPSDLKSKRAAVEDARRAGKTNSSVDLPKFDLSRIPPETRAAAHVPQAPEQLMTPKEDPVCHDQRESPAPPEPHAGEKPVSTETNSCSGRIIREKYASPPDMVVAYDNHGNPHKFPDEPIKSLPPAFGSIPEWRQKQLDQESKELIAKYAGSPIPEEQQLSFTKISELQHEIAQRNDLTELEKCRLYTYAQQIMHEQPVPIANVDEQPQMIDTWQGAKDPWHAVMPLDDKYHNELVNYPTPEAASEEIHKQEDYAEAYKYGDWKRKASWKIGRAIYGINTGDVNASEGQLKAMRQLREKGTFAAYADEWQRQFVRTPGSGQGGAASYEGQP